MITNKTTALIATAAVLVGASFAPNATAQRGGPDWTTSAADPQRTSWVRWDPEVTPEKMTKPGFGKLWAVKMAGTDGKPSEPIMISTYIGYRGFKALALVTGPNYLYTIDYDLGVPYYDKHYGPAKADACAAWPSAVGKLSSLTPIAPRIAREAAGYHTATGKPHEGVPMDMAVGGRLGAAGAPPRVAAPAMQLPPGIRFSVPVFMVTSDGMARSITFDSGKEGYKPVQFLPAGSAPSDLIVVGNVLYAVTMPGCGSAPNSVYALDVATKDMAPTGAWKSTSTVLGPPAFNKEGTLFLSTEKGIVALKPKSLEATPVAEAAVTSTPVIITGKDKEWLAVGTKDGIALMPANGSAATPVKTATDGYTATALSTWDDASGTHWLLATDDTKAKGAVHAYKVTDSGLQPAWTSAELASPGRPIIVDGVVFALSTGADRSGTTHKPATKGTHATVYALDGATGKALWDSGNSITSFVSTGGMSFNESQLYLATYDNTLYAFGHPDPRQ